MSRLAKLLWWRKTVAGKTALGIAVPLLIVFGLFLGWRIPAQRADAYRSVEESHSHHAIMLQELLRETTRASGGHDMQGLVSAVRKAERYTEVVITDWKGEVRYAKYRERIGERLEQTRPECGVCHGASGPRTEFEPRTLILDEGGERFMRTVVPLRNDADCHACHDAARTVNGIAVLEAPTTELDAAVSVLVRDMVFTALALLAIAIAVVYAVQHALVVRPVGDLTRRVRAVEQGDLKPWATVNEADDEIGQLTFAFRSMTERLIGAQRALEDKVQARTEALSEIGEELERLNARVLQAERLSTMGELAATIAHEIRTPLNALAINLQLLKRELNKRPVSDAKPERDTISILEGEIARINGVVEEFMRYARLRPAQLRPIDLAALAQNAIQLLELEARRAGVTLTLDQADTPIMVSGDEERLRQVFLNLVLNAIQAVGRGGSVMVATALEGRAMIRVRDDGPGIPDHVLPTIFKAFVTTKEKGTGLGLAIVSRIVKEHGGSVNVTSNPSAGTCFEVALPLYRAGGDDDAD